MTQKEIAKLLNLSRPTVSLALAGSPNINAETRRRVEEMARSVNYRRNLVSRTLSMKRSHSVGALIPNGAAFYGELSEEMFKHLQQKGYAALFSFDVNQEHYVEALDEMASRGVDGIIAYQYPGYEWKLLELQGQGIPIILFGSKAHECLDCVGIDHYRGGLLAATHLLDCGRRRVACLCYSGDEMREGFRAALRSKGLEPDPRLMFDMLGEADIGHETMRKLLREPPASRPDAVVCHNDLAAIGAMRAALEAGMRIPEDIAFVGRDDLKFSRFLTPPLSTMRIDRPRLAAALCDHLLIKITSGESGAKVTQLLEPELVVRQSSRAGAETPCSHNAKETQDA